MTIKKQLNGFIVISDIVNNRRIERKYDGYTKKEAVKLFNKLKREIKRNEAV